MATDDLGCPVCGRQDAEKRTVNSAVPYTSNGGFENRDNSDSGFSIDCPACGEFVVTYKDDVNLRSQRLRSQWSASHLSALLREQNIRRLPRFWLQYGMAPYGPLEVADLAPIDLNELLTRWPRTIAERIERTLCNLARLSPQAGHEVGVYSTMECSVAFAQSRDEAKYHIQALIDYNLLQVKEEVSGIITNAVVTPAGWARFEELTRGTSAPGNPVFVAMWFGSTEEDKSKMTKTFQQAIYPAIEKAGYCATRVDLSEHNDWIMDKIFGDIRLAPFVVADFTGNRNGVYFEAGFARGLSIPVIHTCREDHLEHAHFDTKQLNHVLWNTPEDLLNKLYHRIVGTIGRGPHLPPNSHD